MPTTVIDSTRSAPATESPGRVLQLFRRMLLIRLCEERLAKAHQRGLIHGACHTYVGQEAIATGVCAHLTGEDMVFSTHRGHGHALAKGVEPRALFGELYGRVDGCSRGRGGSMHLFAPEVGMMGTSGIVGPCILQSAGAGYSFQLLKRKNVAVAFFGDGAVNNGAFHEGLNLASIWNLPVLFVCKNNQYATEVAFEYAAGNPSVAERGAACGLEAVEVDGNDVLAVRDAAQKAIERARNGGGPALLECKTYRTRPHAEGMGDFTYRTREEVDQWKSRCPIKRFREHLLTRQLADETALAAIEKEVAALVKEAHLFAEKSPMPPKETATQHIYAAASPKPAPHGGNGSPESNGPMRELTYMKATVEALSEEVAKNEKIFVLGEGIGERGGNFATTTGLFAKYG